MSVPHRERPGFADRHRLLLVVRLWLVAAPVGPNFTIHGVSSVELGSGVTGQVLSYTRPVDGSEWVALWWEWPYNDAGKTWQQRVVLFLADIGEAEFVSTEQAGFESQSPTVFRPPENLLVGVARALVGSQVEASLTAAR